jgi:dihydroxyacetone kinase
LLLRQNQSIQANDEYTAGCIAFIYKALGMRTKHFLNNLEALVQSSLRSLPLLNPTVTLDEENKIVYDRSQRSLLGGKTVRIISGGGSGHEPSFGAFVGKGGLAAAVAGSVFASPNSGQVLSAIERIKSDGGVLVTVMNYTGDVLNFGVAVEKARTANPQLPIRMLVVGDDVSISQEKAGKVGRRGIAGTVLVHKITGAAAASGRSLDDIFEIGSFILRNIASIGASLDRVHVPGHSVGSSGNESLIISQDEVELGMGIHNERGMTRLKAQEASLPALVQTMLDRVFHSEHSKSTYSSPELGNVVLLVNNLGGVSVLELGAITSEVREQLQKTYNVKPVRTYAGTFMTSLDGPGFSISMLNLGRAERETEILELLDAPIEALGWSSLSAGISWDETGTDTVLDTPAQTATQNGIEENDPQMATVMPHFRAALNAIILAEPDITRYDDIVGDGDCGITLKRGAEGKYL